MLQVLAAKGVLYSGLLVKVLACNQKVAGSSPIRYRFFFPMRYTQLYPQKWGGVHHCILKPFVLGQSTLSLLTCQCAFSYLSSICICSSNTVTCIWPQVGVGRSNSYLFFLYSSLPELLVRFKIYASVWQNSPNDWFHIKYWFSHPWSRI